MLFVKQTQLFFLHCLICHPDRPEIPLNLMAVDLTSRNFTLTWVEPHDNNAPIEGYMYVTNSFQHTVIANTGSATRSMRVNTV